MRLVEWIFEANPSRLLWGKPPAKEDIDVVRFYQEPQYRADVVASYFPYQLLRPLTEATDQQLWTLLEKTRLLTRMKLRRLLEIDISEKLADKVRKRVKQGITSFVQGYDIAFITMREYAIPTIELYCAVDSHRSPIRIIFSVTPLLAQEFINTFQSPETSAESMLAKHFDECMNEILEYKIYDPPIMAAIKDVWHESLLLVGKL